MYHCKYVHEIHASSDIKRLVETLPWIFESSRLAILWLRFQQIVVVEEPQFLKLSSEDWPSQLDPQADNALNELLKPPPE